MEVQKLTKTDVKKIQDEINKRKLEIRPKALEDVKTARAQGDLSENFEYYAAKKFNRENNSRIEYLEKMLKNAIIIEDEEKNDAVGMESYVTILYYDETLDEDDMDRETYKIVTSVRANSMKKKISIESPLGRALLNKKVGDIISVTLENGNGYQVKIIDITKNINFDDDEIKQF